MLLEQELRREYSQGHFEYFDESWPCTGQQTGELYIVNVDNMRKQRDMPTRSYTTVFSQ